jgi:hypothetical protein
MEDGGKLSANFKAFRQVFAFLICYIHSRIPVIHFQTIEFDRFIMYPVNFQTDPIVTVFGP